VSLESRRERAAGRVLDDERLRGPLEDDVFEPLQAWALAWVDAYALATAGLDDQVAEPALDAGLAWVRSQVAALVALLGEWDALPPRARRDRLVRVAPTFAAPRLARRAATLARLRSASEAASSLVAALPRATR
jgi:hypothetical protein